jgi:tRNA(fMet)-specific endonuclease VapC
MQYLLDTNTCIYIIKKKPIEVFEKFSKFSLGEIAISSITLAELEYGVSKSQFVEKNRIALFNFLLPLEILPYTQTATFFYGELRAKLEREGKVIGSMDMLIASHALSENLILVSNNFKEFSRISSLKLENWIK